jgi:hypothetical protein
MRTKLLAKIKKSLEIKKVGYLATEMGISYFQLYRIVTGLSEGKIGTWEKISEYYNKQK